jgi:hypothetical protein
MITPVTARDHVPSWGAVCQFAREAMRAFERDEHAREASAAGWHMAARAVPASRAGHPISAG